MKARVKYIIINTRKREPGTYKKEVHEDVWENLEQTDDLGELGQQIHDLLEFGKSRFVKVLGFEDLGE